MGTLAMITNVQIYGIVAIVIGLFIRYQVGRRRFNRRNGAGVQQFGSYNKALMTTATERLFIIVAGLLLIGGIILILVELYNNSN